MTSRMPIHSKAATLRKLAMSAADFHVDPFVCFAVDQWVANRENILDQIAAAHLGPVIIARSSAVGEDLDDDIPPGWFHSELDVRNSREAITEAVALVISSYRARGLDDDRLAAAEIIIQRQISETAVSGVVTSRTPDDGRPYYTIEFVKGAHATNAVTSGQPCERVYVLRTANVETGRWRRLLEVTRRIEAILDNDNLAIEFAQSADGDIHVFQARMMTCSTKNRRGLSRQAAKLIKDASAMVASSPNTMWSDMLDWNPAEMLGEQASALAISLYRFLFTDGTWAAARGSLGYSDVRPLKLLDLVAGKPYVNARVSLASLVPKALPANLRARLIDHMVATLRSNPELHDRAEFEVAFSCADVAVPRRTGTLRSAGFSVQDIGRLDDVLSRLTSWHVSQAGFQSDRQRLTRLAKLRTNGRIEAQNEPARVVVRRLFTQLNQCRTLGAYSFARTARLAFVARDLLGRLLFSGAIDEQWLDAFWASIHTVTADLSQALTNLKLGQLGRDEFDSQFGHLRPSSYDLMSPRLDELEDDLLMPLSVEDDWSNSTTHHVVSRKVLTSIGHAFRRADLPIDADKFVHFAAEAVQLREFAKFQFTAVLSDCLELIATLGNHYRFQRSEMACLPLEELEIACEADETVVRSSWQGCIAAMTEGRDAQQAMVLPSVIINASDLYEVTELNSRPSFITSRTISGQVVVLPSGRSGFRLDLRGKIVAIEAADPGFDWIFSRGILGLVTKHGGMASHMAIRCAILGLPAAIGCGEGLYRLISRSQKLVLNCRDHSLCREVGGIGSPLSQSALASRAV